MEPANAAESSPNAHFTGQEGPEALEAQNKLGPFYRKYGTVLTTVVSASVYLGTVAYNSATVFVGHIILRNLPVPKSIRPYRQPYVDSGLPSTLALGTLGSAVIAVPILVFTAVFLAHKFAAEARGGPPEDAGGLPRRRFWPHNPLPPRLSGVAWEAWMITSAPLGSLIYRTLIPTSATLILDGVHAALAAMVGRMIFRGLKRLHRLSRAKEDAEIAEELERLQIEVRMSEGGKK